MPVRGPRRSESHREALLELGHACGVVWRVWGTAGVALGMVSGRTLFIPFQTQTPPSQHTESSSRVVAPFLVPFTRGTGLKPLEMAWLLPALLWEDCPGLMHGIKVWLWHQKLL